MNGTSAARLIGDGLRAMKDIASIFEPWPVWKPPGSKERVYLAPGPCVRYLGWPGFLFCAALLGACAATRPHGNQEHSISPPDAYDEFRHGRLMIIDIRPAWERKRDGTVRGAAVAAFQRSVGAHQDFVEEVLVIARGEKTRKLAVLCREGITAEQAQAALLQAGFSSVFIIRGGFLGGDFDPGWMLWGLPVESEHK